MIGRLLTEGGSLSRRSINVSGSVSAKDAWSYADFMLDTGAEINIISQSFAKQCDLKPLEIYEMPSPEWMSGQSVYCYGAYSVEYRLIDSWGQAVKHTSTFFAIDKKGSPLVLGMPALEQAGVQIDLGSRTWRVPLDPDNVSVLEPQQFADTLEGEPAVFAVICAGLSQLDLNGTDTNSPNLPEGLRDLEDVFSNEEAGRLPPFKPGDHAIELDGQDPPYGPIYNLSQRELEVLRVYLDDAKSKGWIRESVSPAGAPILFVPKRDGGLRLCVDYRGLNKVTVKNRHPLPLISETLDRLQGAKRFTKLDLKDAYHRIRIREGDEWKTAFRTRYGHFEYMVMPFGLANAPATFQAYINRALAGLVDITCVVYLDDILIYSEKTEEHEHHVRQVLERLRQFQLYANRKKCEFYTEQVEFLGFIVTTDGVQMDNRRIVAIQDWPVPKTYREVQVFLGFANFYRRFIHHYSQVAAPLTGLLKGSKEGKKTGPFLWGDAEQTAFRTLCDAFTTAPMLVHFDPNRKIRIETDASDFAVAAILSQPDNDGAWHPVAFWSRKMIPAECNYETHDQELLGIVEAFKQWRHYADGSRFPIEVLTDHNNLRGFMQVKHLNGRQARWAIYLAAYDFEIKHQPGKNNPADAPSRRPDYEGVKTSFNQLLPTLQHKLANVGSVVSDPKWQEIIRQAGWSDLKGPREPQTEPENSDGRDVKSPTSVDGDVAGGPLNPVAGAAGCKQHVPRGLARVIAGLELAYNEAVSESVKNLISSLQANDSFVSKQKGRIQRANSKRSASGQLWTVDPQGLLRYAEALYVPEESALRAELISKHHDDELAGHFGVQKTLELLKRKYHWGGLPADVKMYVNTCEVCQRTKIPRHKPYGQMAALPQPKGPWKELSMDFITGLPPSKRGDGVYDAILVVVDRYTKMVRYLPSTVECTAADLAELLFQKVFLRYGSPDGIVSDRGSLFTSSYWSDVCFHLKIKRRLSTAFHPQTDGQTERQNQTLEHYLRVYCNEAQDDWASLLPVAEYAYHNSYHSALGCSPFYAMYGYNPTMQREVEDDFNEGEVPAAKDRVDHLLCLRQTLEDRWRSVQEQATKFYDKKHTPMKFQVGQLVMLSTKNLKLRRPSKKMSPKYAGPFRIKDVIGQQAYRLSLPTAWRIHPVFHVSLLEPYHRRSDGEEQSFMPLPELIDGEEQYDVERIVDRTRSKGVLYYLVKWVGYGEEYNSWISEDDMNADDLRKEYDKEHIAKRRQRRKAS